MIQPSLPGMPEKTPLEFGAEKFVEIKERISAAKLELEEQEKEILGMMKAADVPQFKVSVGGENYEFELVSSEESIRCAKITKTAKKDQRQDIGRRRKPSPFKAFRTRWG